MLSRIRLFSLILTLCIVDCNAYIKNPPQQKEHHAPNREFNMLNINLKLNFDLIKKEILGEASETILPLREKYDSLHLDAEDMKIINVLMDGKDLQFNYDGKELTINLGKEFNTDDTLTYTINYTTEPHEGVFFVLPDSAYPDRIPQIWSQSEMVDARYWFPCHDYPDDFLTSSVTVTVPQDWVVVSNGHLDKVDNDPASKQKTFYWVEDKPHVIYLISIVAGKFKEIDDHYKNIPLEYYVPADEVENAKENFSKTPDILKFYSEITGQEYPWNKLSLSTVSQFTYGGMENISAITLTDYTLHDKNAEPQESSTSLIAHETAHQWFGDLLTCRTWSNAWLNEGFATYFEALYNRHLNGEDSFQYEMLHDQAAVIRADKTEIKPTVFNKYNYPVDVFNAYIYARGASILNMLRGILGDTLFFHAIHYYVEKFKHQNVDTHDFKNAIQESTGYNLYWFFDEWLYKGGHPVFDVSYAYDDINKSLQLNVSQVQKTDEMTPVFKMPVEISIITKSRTYYEKVWVDSTTNIFKFAVFEKPLMVNIDPKNYILKETHFNKTEEELKYQLTNDSNVTGRIWAVNQLAKLYNDKNDEAISDAIITALKKDPFWGVRQMCALNLSGFPSNDNAKESLLFALQDKDMRVVEAAENSLGKFSGKEVSAALLDIYKNNKNYFVRAAAVTSIGKVDTTEAMSVIKDALNTSSYRDVIKTSALRVLSKLNPDEAYQKAIMLAQYGEPDAVRLAAINIISSEAKENKNAMNLLKKYAVDPYIWARMESISAIGKAGNETDIPFLIKIEQNEKDGRLKKAAADAIKSIQNGGNS